MALLLIKLTVDEPTPRCKKKKKKKETRSRLGYLVIVIRSKVDGDESEPHDAGGVHGESNVFGFVEIFRYFTRFEGVKGAQDNEQHVVKE